MKPILFTVPGINWDVPGYGVMLMLGLFISIWWAARRAIRSRANPDVILNCGFIAIIAGVVGSRLMYVIHYWGEQFANRGGFLETAWAVINVSRGGLEFYGGLILTAVAVLLWLRFWEKVSIRWYLDIIAPSAVLGLAIGRIGCFLNGCCFGSTCDLPWAVRFPFGSNVCVHQWQRKLPGAALREELLYTYPSGVVQPLPRELLYMSAERLAAMAEVYRELAGPDLRLDTITDPAERARLRARLSELGCSARKDLNNCQSVFTNMARYGLSAAEMQALAGSYRSLPVHPTQLYSTITALLIALLLNALYWRRTRDGQVTCALFVIQPVARWMLEVIRADNPHDTIGDFTISQFLAVCMTLLGLIGLLVLRRLPPRSPRAKAWEPPELDPRNRAGAKKRAPGAG
jgi:phosphatidylglycerol:prolipoprotein diacylglycerol transferase